jgi:uncharacterized membrane protein YdjX (TVP38/TMEM64 family)
MKNSLYIKSALFIVLALALIVSQFLWDISSYLDPERIRQWLESAGVWAPLFYMMIMAAAVVISPIPSLPLDIAAGAFFGPVMGTVYSVAGGLGGAVVSFMIARFLGRGIIEKFVGGHVNFCRNCSNRVLTKIVFVSRLIPIVSFDVVSYGAGLTNMSPGRFVAATLFGMIPLTFIYNYSGTLLVFGGELTLALGIVMVLLFFFIPRWMEGKGMMIEH